MPFKVRRWNELRGTTQDSAQQFTTRAEAFDAAWDNAGTFIKNNVRQSRPGDRDHPPSRDVRFKIWVELRPGRDRGLHLRYDYPVSGQPGNPGGQFETNEIRWRIVQV